MDLKASRDTDEFGSVYSFDGLVNKIKKHNLVHPVSSSPPQPAPPWKPPDGRDFFAGHRGSVTGSNGAAVTGNGFRRFSVFSQQQPLYPPSLNGGLKYDRVGVLDSGGKMEGLSEAKGSDYGASSVILDQPEKIRKPKLSEDSVYQKVGTTDY